MTTPQNRRARARVGDPFTSQAAAAVATRSLPTVRATVYSILEAADGPLTHDQLIAAYRRRQMDGLARAGASDSSIRSRCNELEKDELVIVVDQGGRSRMGNPARRYAARTVYDPETVRLEDGALL